MTDTRSPTRKLALFGDEQEQHTDGRMIERLLRLIGARRPRIGYIAEAVPVDQGAFAIKRDFYAGIGAQLSTYFDAATAGDLIPDLLGNHAIHLSGGNTFSFLYWLQRRGMIPRLRQYVAHGGVLIGVSAGSILMTPSVHTAALCGDPPDPRLVDYSALKLVDFHFWPHFDPHRALNAQELALAASQPNLYACGGGAGIIVEDDAVELYSAVAPYPAV